MSAPFLGDPSSIDRARAVAQAIRDCPHRRPSACHGMARCALGMGDRGRVTRQDCEACVASSDRWRQPERSSSRILDAEGSVSLPSEPTFFDANDRPLPLAGTREGRAVALFCGGPSLAGTDLSPFMAPWCDRAAVNNAGALVRPHWWFALDEPRKFHQSIWEDPNCWKFAGRDHRQYPTRVKEGGAWRESGKVAHQHPSVAFYRRHRSFDHTTWMGEPIFSWGSSEDRSCSLGMRGAKSVLFIALKSLLVLGYRSIYLLGCDWYMPPDGAQYGFPQEKDERACNSNNAAYLKNGRRLAALRPLIESLPAEVVNATPGSRLDAFRCCSPEEASEAIRAANEREVDLAGWYTT